MYSPFYVNLTQKKGLLWTSYLPKMSHLTLHLLNRRRVGGEEAELLPATEEMDQ
jgi:hypothetical protein